MTAGEVKAKSSRPSRLFMFLTFVCESNYSSTSLDPCGFWAGWDLHPVQKEMESTDFTPRTLRLSTIATKRPDTEHTGEGQIRLQLPCSEKKRAGLSTLKEKWSPVGIVEVSFFLQCNISWYHTTFITLFYFISICLSLKGKLSPGKCYGRVTFASWCYFNNSSRSSSVHSAALVHTDFVNVQTNTLDLCRFSLGLSPLSR